jgi:hypothetical protein
LTTFRHCKAKTESEIAEMSSWGHATYNRGENLGFVWRNRKKISEITNDYIYLPFFLLITYFMGNNNPLPKHMLPNK